MHTCSKCGWTDTRQSLTRGPVDIILGAVGLVPVRCRKCRNRFYRFKRVTFKSLLALFAAALLIFAASYWFVTVRRHTVWNPVRGSAVDAGSRASGEADRRR